MEENKEVESKVKVEIDETGPVKITGNFILKDLQRGTETKPGEVLLCACGKTSRQPFCDNSHEKKS
jgi:CDGSH-type Zn-finger protein